MEIYVSKNAGFCFGVRSAINKAVETARLHGKALTLGEIIHNRQVVRLLESKGVYVVQSLDEVTKDDHVVIRSHGVSKSVYDVASVRQLQLIDATCPFVRKIQRIAQKYDEKGYTVIIVGSKSHPEVIGIKGHTGDRAVVIGSGREIDTNIEEKIIASNGVCVVAQTTITKLLWNDVTDKLSEILKSSEKKNTVLNNTICSTTAFNQEATRKLAETVDLMIVIGGKNSSNTQKLYEISRELCKISIYIETIYDLNVKDIAKYDKIGVTAGASTPDWVIDEVVEKLRNEGGVIING